VFRDEIEIEVRAGRGGDGLVSFRREKSMPKGGPDGGDGGDGGSVILRASAQENSLLKLGRRKHYVADNGRPGGPSNKSGKSGADLVLDVPIGTQVFDARHGNLLFDLAAEHVTLAVAQGGRGGKGNQHFATSVRQTPRFAQRGADGEKLRVRLELKLFAEVGLVGLPNAGKSTFLSKVTAATPKIADYPFTTLVPQVGIATIGDYDTLVLADLPGLIEGASEGAGLGHRFLKHVERCRALLQLVDCSPLADVEPADAFRVVDAELERASAELHAKPRLVAASKCESEEAEQRARELEQAIGMPVLRCSAATGRGLEAVLRAAQALVRASRER
jgi:GTP-binding protein